METIGIRCSLYEVKGIPKLTLGISYFVSFSRLSHSIRAMIKVEGQLDTEYLESVVAMYFNGAFTEKELKEEFLKQGLRITDQRKAKRTFEKIAKEE